MAEAPAVQMPTDEHIIQELNVILQGVDWDNTTERMVRQQLEARLGVSLSSKKAMISQQIDHFMNANPDKVQAEAEAAEAEPEPAPKPRRKAEPKKRKAAAADGEEGGEKKKRAQPHCLLSPELQAFLGVETLPRFQVVKQIWAYIKEHNLQDPNNKREIICDDKMRTIFKPPINMFSMNKQLSVHIKSAGDTA